MMRKWIEKLLHLRSPVPRFIRTSDILWFLMRRGGTAYLNGLLKRWQFKSCGRRLIIGRRSIFYFPRFISLGNHVFIANHCIFHGLSTKGFQIGNRVHIREYTLIQATSQLNDPGIGAVIEDDVYIGPHGYLGAGGGIHIGKGSVLGAYVQLLAENHNFDNPDLPICEQGVLRKGIHVGENVWVGNSAIILDGVEIGNGSVIGAGTVVTKSVPENSIVAGNPGRVIRQRGSR